MEYKLQTTSSRDRGHIHGMQYYIIVFFVQPCLKNTQPQSSRNKYFDNFDTFNTPATTNPVDEWLNTPPVSTATNGLQYWAAMLASGHPLARMALDFLSVPGQCMSVYHSLFANFSSSYIHWCREGLLPWGSYSIKNATFTVGWEHASGICTWLMVWFTRCRTPWGDYDSVQGQG